MSSALHPAAPHHLPGFITAPGETDVLMVGGTIFLIIAVLGLGSVYFRLHSLPEKLAHGNASKVQFEVVAVLAPACAADPHQLALGGRPDPRTCADSGPARAAGEDGRRAGADGGVAAGPTAAATDTGHGAHEVLVPEPQVEAAAAESLEPQLPLPARS